MYNIQVQVVCKCERCGALARFNTMLTVDGWLNLTPEQKGELTHVGLCPKCGALVKAGGTDV